MVFGFLGTVISLERAVALRRDLTGSFTAARWGGLLNATAIGLFLLATLTSAVLAGLQRARALAPTPFQQPVGIGR